jgi:hypothetical protein
LRVIVVEIHVEGAVGRFETTFFSARRRRNARGDGLDQQLPSLAFLLCILCTKSVSSYSYYLSSLGSSGRILATTRLRLATHANLTSLLSPPPTNTRFHLFCTQQPLSSGHKTLFCTARPALAARFAAQARLTPRAAPSIYWPCPSTLRSGHSAPFTHLPDTSYHLAYHSTALSAPGP